MYSRFYTVDLDGVNGPDVIAGQSDSGFVDTLLANWGTCADCPSDLDEDGTVGPIDLQQLIAQWGPCVAP